MVWEESVNRKVYPSGADFAAASVPTAPPAPPRFSMTIVCPSASDRRFCTMRAMTSVPPPGGYGTMKRTGFAGQSCAHAGIAASRPSARTIPFLTAASSEPFLVFLAGGQQFESRSQRGLNAAMFRLDFANDLAGFFGVSAARRRLDVPAIPAQHPRADGCAARFERMSGACDLRRIIGGRRLLQFLHELRRLDQIKIDHTGEQFGLALQQLAQLIQYLPIENLSGFRGGPRCELRDLRSRGRRLRHPAIQHVLQRRHAERLGPMPGTV